MGQTDRPSVKDNGEDINEEFPDGSLYLTPSSEDSETQCKLPDIDKSGESHKRNQAITTNADDKLTNNRYTDSIEQKKTNLAESKVQRHTHDLIESNTTKSDYMPSVYRTPDLVERDKKVESRDSQVGKQKEIHKDLDEHHANQNTTNSNCQPIDYSKPKCIKQPLGTAETQRHSYDKLQTSTLKQECELPIGKLWEGHEPIDLTRPIETRTDFRAKNYTVHESTTQRHEKLVESHNPKQSMNHPVGETSKTSSLPGSTMFATEVVPKGNEVSEETNFNYVGLSKLDKFRRKRKLLSERPSCTEHTCNTKREEMDGTKVKKTRNAEQGAGANVQEGPIHNFSPSLSYPSTVVQQFSIIEQMAKSVAAATIKEEPSSVNVSKHAKFVKLIKQYNMENNSPDARAKEKEKEEKSNLHKNEREKTKTPIIGSTGQKTQFDQIEEHEVEKNTIHDFDLPIASTEKSALQHKPVNSQTVDKEDGQRPMLPSVRSTKNSTVEERKIGHPSTRTNITDDGHMGKSNRKEIIVEKKSEDTGMKGHAAAATTKNPSCSLLLEKIEKKETSTKKSAHPMTVGGHVKEVLKGYTQERIERIPFSSKTSTYKFFDKRPFLSAEGLANNSQEVEKQEELEEFKRRAGVEPTTTIMNKRRTLSRGRALYELSAKNEPLQKSAMVEEGRSANFDKKKVGHYSMEGKEVLEQQNKQQGTKQEVEEIKTKQPSPASFSEEVVGGPAYHGTSLEDIDIFEDASVKEESGMDPIDAFISKMNARKRTDVPGTYRRTGQKTSRSGTIEFNARLSMQRSGNVSGLSPLTSTPKGKGTNSATETQRKGSDEMNERRRKLVILDHTGTQLSNETLIKLPKVLNKNPPTKKKKKKARQHPPHSGDDGSDISSYHTSEEEDKDKTEPNVKKKKSRKVARKEVVRNSEPSSDDEGEDDKRTKKPKPRQKAKKMVNKGRKITTDTDTVSGKETSHIATRTRQRKQNKQKMSEQKVDDCARPQDKEDRGRPSTDPETYKESAIYKFIAEKPKQDIVAVATFAYELDWIDHPGIKQWDVFNTDPLWALKNKVLKNNRVEQINAYETVREILGEALSEIEDAKKAVETVDVAATILTYSFTHKLSLADARLGACQVPHDKNWKKKDIAFPPVDLVDKRTYHLANNTFLMKDFRRLLSVESWLDDSVGAFKYYI